MKLGVGEEPGAFAIQVITGHHHTAGQPSGGVGKADCGRGVEEELRYIKTEVAFQLFYTLHAFLYQPGSRDMIAIAAAHGEQFAVNGFRSFFFTVMDAR